MPEKFNSTNEKEDAFEKKEKPDFLYHGSPNPGIQELEPRRGHTPDGKDLARSFTSDLPAFAAVQGFPWDNREGFKLSVENGKVIFKVPVKFRQRLRHKLYLYTVPSDNFEWTMTERTGHTYDSPKKTKPTGVQEFSSVQEAIEHFGGQVIYYGKG